MENKTDLQLANFADVYLAKDANIGPNTIICVVVDDNHYFYEYRGEVVKPVSVKAFLNPGVVESDFYKLKDMTFKKMLRKKWASGNANFVILVSKYVSYAKNKRRIRLATTVKSLRNFEVATSDIHHIENGRQTLQRYMSYSAFINLLYTNQIAFTSLDLASDKLERLNLDGIKLVQRMDGKRKSVMLLRQSSKNTAKETVVKNFISCWHVNFNGLAVENMQMWKNYAGMDGIMIEVDYSNLNIMFMDGIAKHLVTRNNIGRDSRFINSWKGLVLYKNLQVEEVVESDMTSKVVGFYKDMAYHNESEFRFLIREYVTHNTKEVFNLDFNINIIKSIKTGPSMAKWQYDSLKIILSKFNLKEKDAEGKPLTLASKLEKSFYTGLA